jgi:hypothetical protein
MNPVLKPYFLLACVAFFVGFVSYLALGSALGSAQAQVQDDWQATISAPADPVVDAPLARGKQI